MRTSTILPDPSIARRVDREMFLLLGGTASLLLRAMIVAVRALRRLMPELLTVVPQARRYERARRGSS